MDKGTKIARWMVRGSRILQPFFLFVIAASEGSAWWLAGVGLVISIFGIAVNQLVLEGEDRIVW